MLIDEETPTTAQRQPVRQSLPLPALPTPTSSKNVVRNSSLNLQAGDEPKANTQLSENKSTAVKGGTDSQSPNEQSSNPVYSVCRKICLTIAGVVTLLAGIAMLVLPGPGWLVIFMGLGILGAEYAWARHLCRSIRIRAMKAWVWLWKKRVKAA